LRQGLHQLVERLVELLDSFVLKLPPGVPLSIWRTRPNHSSSDALLHRALHEGIQVHGREWRKTKPADYRVLTPPPSEWIILVVMSRKVVCLLVLIFVLLVSFCLVSFGLMGPRFFDPKRVLVFGRI
jgi:hypothetical protein